MEDTEATLKEKLLSENDVILKSIGALFEKTNKEVESLQKGGDNDGE